MLSFVNSLNLVRGVKYVVHALESLFPLSDLVLDGFPFFLIDFAHLVTLNDELLVELVDGSIDNFVSNSFNRPFFYFVFVDVKQASELFVFEVSLGFSAELADLQVRFLLNDFTFFKTFLLHEGLEFAELTLEGFSISFSEKVKEFEQLSVAATELLNGRHFLQLFEVDYIASLNGLNNTTAGCFLSIGVELLLVVLI